MSPPTSSSSTARRSWGHQFGAGKPSKRVTTRKPPKRLATTRKLPLLRTCSHVNRRTGPAVGLLSHPCASTRLLHATLPGLLPATTFAHLPRTDCMVMCLQTEYRWSALEAWLLLILLLGIQIIYAFAFLDAGLLLFSLNQFPAFADQINLSHFYANSILRFDPIPAVEGYILAVPTLNFAVALISVNLLYTVCMRPSGIMSAFG